MKLFKILKRAAGLYFRKPLVFYIALPNTQVPNLNVPKEISFVSIDNINEYLKIIAKFKIPFSPFSEQPLKTEQYLVFCTIIMNI